MMWFYFASACIKEASGGLVPQGSATTTLGRHCIACGTASDHKYAKIRSIIDNGKPRHLGHPLGLSGLGRVASRPHTLTSSHLTTVIARALLDLWMNLAIRGNVIDIPMHLFPSPQFVLFLLHHVRLSVEIILERSQFQTYTIHATRVVKS
jgi:hypothetical protein